MRNPAGKETKVEMLIILSPNNKTISGITTAWSHSPGSASTQHKGYAVSCEYSSQPWEITVSVCSLLENLSYTSRCLRQQPHPYQTQGLLTIFVLWIKRKLHVTSFGGASSWENSTRGTLGEGVQSTSFACSAIQRFSTDPVHPHDAAELTASGPVPLCSPASAPTEKVRTWVNHNRTLYY